MSYFRSVKLWILLVLLILTAAIAWLSIHEMRTSKYQARYFSRIASQLSYKLVDGVSPSIRFPTDGPYDERLGYTRIAEFTDLLKSHGFVVTQQARMSPALLNLKLPPIYPEKDQAGLDLRDRNQQMLYSDRSPERVYANFETIPKLLTDTLLFIEDRELLDTRYPMRNPAVNWPRLGLAVADQAVHVFDSSHDAPGASTLVTQIEKYRHSPDGLTTSAHEKLLQMKSASIRAYLYGQNNIDSRRRAVRAYLNTVPLTAKAGYGEINGLGDGMWAWYGRDFADVNALLNSRGRGAEQRMAKTYKQALSLMISQRRPSYFLRKGAPALMQMTDNHLRLLRAAGIISPALLKAALPIRLELNQGQVAEADTSFVSRKAVNSLRGELSGLLHVPRLYDLDRMDLSVKSTLDGEAQQLVTAMLHQVQSTAGAQAAGLYGHNMLSTGDDPGRLSFSFTLFERVSDANLLRVQTDNLNQPFDINSGARLNLGSTAKLRTLITYLDIIARLHASHGGQSRDELLQLAPDRHDALSIWTFAYLAAHPGCGLADILEAAMLRTYSGNPSERFYTGGGMQQFTNFDPDENGRMLTVREGFKHSVNLVFVRLMRDIVRYYEFNLQGGPTSAEGISPDITADPEASITSADAVRQAALSRFADKEGREFLNRFYNKYKGKTGQEAAQVLIDGARARPRHLSLLFRSLEPRADFNQFASFMREQLAAPPGESSLQALYEQFGIDKYSLTDRGYLIGIHPLELWLVAFLQHNPDATRAQIMDASRDQRQEVYGWLFNTRNKRTQESRIHQMMELDAFVEIAANWRHMGYPFDNLTPSYATALGASGDRPSSLAQLMGIIVNKGMLLPVRKLQSLKFAQGTPYETRFAPATAKAERVLPEEVAQIVRRSLVDVVQAGTAVRLKKGFTQKEGEGIEMGGKTGTGDQRFASYAANGRLIESRAVNRSATFVFLIGERFFGTVTAYVHEPYAADYAFTSALTVQLLKSMIPALQPLVAGSAESQIP